MNSVNVIVNLDKNFLLLAYVWIYSLAENSNENRTYNIYLLSRTLNQEDIESIRKCIVSFHNINVISIDASKILDEYNFDMTWNSNSVVYYANLFIPSIFPQMSRCIYMDVDMVVMTDVGILFDYDMNDKCIGVVSAYGTRGKTNSEDKKYFAEVLDIEEDELYFNNATMLMNLNAIREKNLLSSESIAYFAGKRLRFADQDVMNYFMKKDVLYLDPRWNVGEVKDYSMIDERYYQASLNPYVIHYNGKKKPIMNISVARSDAFWTVARKTPYYEKMLLSLIENQMDDYSRNIRLEVLIKSFLKRIKNKILKRKKA